MFCSHIPVVIVEAHEVAAVFDRQRMLTSSLSFGRLNLTEIVNNFAKL
jgi:hypothetical protein